MTEDEIDELFNETKKSCPGLLNCRFMLAEKQIKKFQKHCSELQNLLQEIRLDFPSANYFVEGESGLHLMLGSPGGEESTRLDKMYRSACTADNLEISVGAI